jgi:hypothetical protein
MKTKSPGDKTVKGGVRAYAKHRNCSPMAVERAIKSGRITRDSKGQIDFRRADRDWARNSQPRVAPAASGPSISAEEDTGPGAAQYLKARAVREFFQANLARVEYEERIGKLLPKDEVQTAAFNRFRQFRDAMLNIPVRVAAIFGAESSLSSQRCHEILDAEIRRALNDFADSPNARV